MPGIETRRVIFLDLDDTLIPTVWIRGQFLFRRDLRFHEFKSYARIREELDKETEWKLETAVCDFILAVREFCDHAIVVTNARSEGWLKIFEDLFPILSLTLRNCGIKLLRTSPEKISEPDCDLHPEEYFQYWTAAKLTEFQRVLSEIGDVSFDLVCIGDNDFEHAAFSRLIESTPSVVQARSIKCSQGLAPSPFLEQVRIMTSLLKIWFSTPKFSVQTTRPVKIGSYLTLQAWCPKNFEIWLARRQGDSPDQTSTCETLC